MRTATTCMLVLTACFVSAGLLPARRSGVTINLTPARSFVDAPAAVPAGFGTPVVRRHGGSQESGVAVGSSTQEAIAPPSGTTTVDKNVSIAAVCNSTVTAATTGTPQYARFRPRWASNHKRAYGEPIYPIRQGNLDIINAGCAAVVSGAAAASGFAAAFGVAAASGFAAASGVAAATGAQVEGAAAPTGVAGSAEATAAVLKW